MSRRIAPIFLPNLGCPHRCIFCNERITAGKHPVKVSRELMEEAVSFFIGVRPCQEERQIAFYGGNFTGIEPNYQLELLGTAKELVESGRIDSIRLSTRPDCIDEKTLEALKKFSVRSIEIGAQSMVDAVLEQSRRGHTAQDTQKAVTLLKTYGFETGVHLMLGLPGDTRTGFRYTLDQIIALKPDTVRIHPTIVFEGTELAEMYRSGDYHPLDLDTAVDECRFALSRLRQSDIKVIRIGLQATPEMNETGSVLAGPFHPAFRALVEGSIFLDMAENLLVNAGFHASQDTVPEFFIADQDMSDFRGIGNRNIILLRKQFGVNVLVKSHPALKRGELILETGGKRFYRNRFAAA
jgi:histone acetyltransferase (RNA polymerase elongator complex component)